LQAGWGARISGVMWVWQQAQVLGHMPAAWAQPQVGGGSLISGATVAGGAAQQPQVATPQQPQTGAWGPSTLANWSVPVGAAAWGAGPMMVLPSALLTDCGAMIVPGCCALGTTAREDVLVGLC
jgi:hypothetical protein